jgi:hypothetical protein
MSSEFYCPRGAAPAVPGTPGQAGSGGRPGGVRGGWELAAACGVFGGATRQARYMEAGGGYRSTAAPTGLSVYVHGLG